MFAFLKSNKKSSGVALSLCFYNENNKNTYAVRYESCEYNGYARVKVLDEYRDRMDKQFKRWIPNSRLDNMVGEALRNGFFSLKPVYQGYVKDNYKYVLSLTVGDRTHTVVDSFGAAPLWVREFEQMMMKECFYEGDDCRN